MNQFLASVVDKLKRHGEDATYVRVVEGSYNVETGSVTNTETSYTVRIYKRHISANQYQYPDLIGKDAAVIYLAGNALTFAPSVRDKFIISGVTYNVESISEHRARNQIVLYKLASVRG